MAWKNEPQRHALARKGVKTGVKVCKTVNVKKIRPSQIQVNRTHYKVQTGRYPQGYGTWAFQIGNKENIEDVFFCQGNYSECKQKAIQKACDDGEYTVKVLT